MAIVVIKVAASLDFVIIQKRTLKQNGVYVSHRFIYHNIVTDFWRINEIIKPLSIFSFWWVHIIIKVFHLIRIRVTLFPAPFRNNQPFEQDFIILFIRYKRQKRS